MNDKVKKFCFVISPIGADGSTERNNADWFLAIVHEALGADYRIERADDHKKSGLITTQIIALIEMADLIVADLTGHNANVHYELGVAHAREKQVVPMMMKGDIPPFDNAQMRTLFYSRASPRDHAAAVHDLRERVEALTDHVQNPVTHALGTLKLSQGDDKDQIIASVSAQVANHEAELARLQKAFGDLAGIVARDIHSRTPEPPGNFLTGKLPQAGGLFGLGGNVLSPPSGGGLGDLFDPSKSPPKK